MTKCQDLFYLNIHSTGIPGQDPLPLFCILLEKSLKHVKLYSALCYIHFYKIINFHKNFKFLTMCRSTGVLRRKGKSLLSRNDRSQVFNKKCLIFSYKISVDRYIVRNFIFVWNLLKISYKTIQQRGGSSVYTYLSYIVHWGKALLH